MKVAMAVIVLLAVVGVAAVYARVTGSSPRDRAVDNRKEAPRPAAERTLLPALEADPEGWRSSPSSSEAVTSISAFRGESGSDWRLVLGWEGACELAPKAADGLVLGTSCLRARIDYLGPGTGTVGMDGSAGALDLHRSGQPEPRTVEFGVVVTTSSAPAARQDAGACAPTLCLTPGAGDGPAPWLAGAAAEPTVELAPGTGRDVGFSGDVELSAAPPASITLVAMIDGELVLAVPVIDGASLPPEADLARAVTVGAR